MARRADPARLYAAHRAGLLNRLVRDARIGEATAERWVSAWEAEARARGLEERAPEFGPEAWGWIAEQPGL